MHHTIYEVDKIRSLFFYNLVHSSFVSDITRKFRPDPRKSASFMKQQIIMTS